MGDVLINFQRLRCSAILLKNRKKRKCTERKYWVHPINSQRLLKGQIHILFEDLLSHPEKFFNFHRMSIDSFNVLLGKLLPISKEDTVMRKCISLEERLSVTLRYLGTGNSFVSLHHEYLIGESTIRKIVLETCSAIWRLLSKKWLPKPTEEKWLEISEKFYTRTGFPNCLGAIGGKYIHIKMPQFSGKNFFSIVLLAIVDADYSFSFVDIGHSGRNSDCNVFTNSVLSKKLKQNTLSVPEKRTLPLDENGKPVPFVFIGDEAFAVSSHLMRPYPKRSLGEKKQIFNYRLNRARRTVERAFGIFANKWKIFHRRLDVNLEFSVEIVKAACVLHNFVRKRDGVSFEDTIYSSGLEDIPKQGTRGNTRGVEIRDYFASYFSSPQGSAS